jgi:hypothetical protein
VRAVDVAPYDDVVFCPACGREVQDTVGTPQIPTETLLDFEVAEVVGDEIPVYGYRCNQHRSVDVLLAAPVDLAPESYVPVDAELDGEVSAVAVPPAVLEADSQ